MLFSAAVIVRSMLFLAAAMLFSAAAISIFGRGPSTYSRNPIDCRDAIFGQRRSPFSRLGVQYKFTESSGISGCCLSWAGISLWLGCARILVSLFGFERGAI